jgi:hypothetical protein
MSVAVKRIFDARIVLFWLYSAFMLVGCTSASLPPGAIGNAGKYNYSPSIIEGENTRQFWWCSQGRDPTEPSLDTDAIYYASMNLLTREVSSPVLVLAESPGTWDAAYTCNPKVIAGVFQNPLGDGQTYVYAMYYVATARGDGTSNSIGVAFSKDGIQWTKYPDPVIMSTAPAGSGNYGVGQPALYNADHNAAITMFYEDRIPSIHHVAAVSKDGVHFTVQGTLTQNGLDLDDPEATWGDMSYDSKAGEWYAIFNSAWRPTTITGDIQEYGQYGVELYKIPQNAILTGSSPWQQLITTDTNSNGFESNFISGFVRDKWGNLNVKAYPTIQMYTSVSYPAPAWDATPAEAATSGRFDTWILMPMSWAPNTTTVLALNRYFNRKVYEVTTGWVSPEARFTLQKTLAHLQANPLSGATTPFYGCKAGQLDYFVSLDVNCEGQRSLGKEGYGYSQAAVSGLNLIALYRCISSNGHFVSTDPKCEGQKTDELLGYAAP